MAIFHKKVLRYFINFIMYLQVLGKMSSCPYLKAIRTIFSAQILSFFARKFKLKTI